MKPSETDTQIRIMFPTYPRRYDIDEPEIPFKFRHSESSHREEIIVALVYGMILGGALMAIFLPVLNRLSK